MPFVAGNWKMHLDRAGVDALCAGLARLELEPERLGVRLGVFPGFVHLRQAVDALAGHGVVVGAQTGRPEAQGAFTGEVSLAQVRDAGATHVILGHSERRHVLGETDADVRGRLEAALALGLHAIVCVGETLAEREAGRTRAVVLGQLDAALSGLAVEGLAERVTLAYEPVWAIGTGRVATPEQAQEVHALLRGRAAELCGPRVAEGLTLQYGGSVKPDNIASLMACPDVDGALVGGASLDLSSFEAIARRAAPSPRGAGSKA